MIIFASGGLELLQMVSKPDIGRCANEEAGLRRGWIGSLSSIGEGNECNDPDPPLADIVLFGLFLSGFPSRL